MKIAVKKRILLKSAKVKIFVASSLLLFTAPVFALQHSSCYLNDCSKIIGDAFQLPVKKSADELPCHSSNRTDQDKAAAETENNCNSNDTECVFQIPQSESEKTVSSVSPAVIIISFIHYNDENSHLTPDAYEKHTAAFLNRKSVFSSQPLYIQNLTLLI